MKIWVLKIHVLGEEFMDTMDDAPTCTAPCTGVESPVSPSPPPTPDGLSLPPNCSNLPVWGAGL